MKKSMYILFGLRLFFYFSVITLIFIHPGISVSFDSVGIMQWFIIIPLMAGFAFVPDSVVSVRYKRIAAFSLLFILSVFAGITRVGMLQLFTAGLISFALTHFLFTRSRWAKIASLEPFFFAWVCLRLLSLSRSGEEIAGQSMALTQFILVWTAVVFLMHSMVIYLCINSKSCKKVWKEGITFSFVTLAVLVILLFVLPPDFVRNAIIENLVTERQPVIIPPSNRDRPFDGRGGSRRTLPNSNGRNSGELRGISEHEWDNRNRGRGSGSSDQQDNRQYMVKIVVADREPVYMGEFFRGQLDPIEGFLQSSIEPLNELSHQRFFTTWKNNERNTDIGRALQEVVALSTLQEKFMPWYPVTIDPTILSENSGPLRYIHQVESNTHLGDPFMLVNKHSRRFTESERRAFEHYLEVPLEESDKREFTSYVNTALNNWRRTRESFINSDSILKQIYENEEAYINEHLETIIALMTSFSVYQYDIFLGEDYTISTLKEFLFNSKEGNCTEFSNTLALLGRIAGIPSRVVTGYLASEGLQTPAHLRGLSVLQSQIPFLQEFPFDNLFMVTNVHGHSWTQFYIPDYGWLDFEATMFAIPPIGMGDFNTWDIIIPILSDEKTVSQIRKFPWRAVGRILVSLVIFALVGAYVLLYGRIAILFIGSKKQNRAGARSLYLLLLARLASDGQPIKPASKTAHEYSQLFAKSGLDESCFKAFADIYGEIRWRQFTDKTEEGVCFKKLTFEYQNILKSTRRPGLHHAIKRLFSLRGLAYL